MLALIDRPTLSYLQVCSTLTTTYVGYKKRGLVNCAACCNDAPGNDGPCNAHLCGVGKNWILCIKHLNNKYDKKGQYIAMHMYVDAVGTG